MRISSPDVTYVATSEQRAKEIKAQLKPAVSPVVIPNMVDPVRVFGLTPEMRESLPSLLLSERDFVFLLPARVMVRKNIEFAIEVVKRLVELERNPFLMITGAGDTNSVAAKHYGDFLRQSLPKHLLNHVVFVNDFFSVLDETLRDLMLVSDCLIYPSRQEGFGLPVIEAGLFRLPVWCNNVPACQALGTSETFLLDDLAKISAAVAWLEAQPIFRQQRKCRQVFDPSVIYRKYYEPFLSVLASKLTQSSST
jgi:glycosyltransferase involved in cell wall biosynthesis